MEKKITPEYQQQLESLARTLTERFRQEVVIEGTDLANQSFQRMTGENRWDSLGNYTVDL